MQLHVEARRLHDLRRCRVVVARFAHESTKMKKIALLGFAAMLASSVALAVAPPAWSTGALTVTNIEARAVGTTGSQTYLTFSSYPNNNAGCTNTSQALVVGHADNAKAITYVATSALVSGKQVRVYWDAGCSGAYGKVSRLELVN